MKKPPELTDTTSHATFAFVTSRYDTWLIELWDYKGLCIFVLLDKQEGLIGSAKKLLDL